MRPFRALLPLQILDMAKHTLCLTSSCLSTTTRRGSSGHHTLFHGRNLCFAATSTTRGALPQPATTGAAHEPGDSSRQQAKIRAVFLPNNGEWVDYQERFIVRSQRGEEDRIHDRIKNFEKISLTQLRREARDAGLSGSGSKEDVLKRSIGRLRNGFASLSVPELRREAKERGQRSSGPKDELVSRLMRREPPRETKTQYQVEFTNLS